MQKTLLQKIESKQHPICIGFDPDFSSSHEFIRTQQSSLTNENFLLRWYEAIINACGADAHSIKFQSAFFEALGPNGFSVLKDLILDAKRRGIYTILDAKRGDIASTMSAYGKAAFEALNADALTILPWMGTDTLAALEPWLKNRRGAYVVWLSSNQSGRHLQTSKLNGDKTVATFVFEQFYSWAQKAHVEEQLGWVLGATDLSLSFVEKVTKKPQSFLCPGIGAQGASFGQESVALCKAHPSSLFPISRGILKPDHAENIHNWKDYEAWAQSAWTSFKTQWQNAQP